MHAKSGLCVVLKWKIFRPDSVIAAVITLNHPFETFVIMKSSFNDLFSGGASVWLKIAGAAIVAPAIVFGASRKMARQGNELFADLPTTIGVLAGTSVVGAFLGAALSMKDVVAKRIEDGKPVNWFLRLFFARGILTVLAWVPFFIVAMVFVLNILGI